MATESDQPGESQSPSVGGGVAPPEVIAAARAADAKRAHDVVILEVGPISAVAAYFVICSAGTARQVRAITEAVEESVAETSGLRPLGVEGRDTLEWVLINYGDVLVHVFQQESRDFYDLERLWADAARCEWTAASPPSTPGEDPEVIDDPLPGR